MNNAMKELFAGIATLINDMIFTIIIPMLVTAFFVHIFKQDVFTGGFVMVIVSLVLVSLTLPTVISERTK